LAASGDAPEFAARRAALAARLPELRLDALLVTALPNVRYLAGFTGSNAMLLAFPDRALLFTDPRYAIQARNEADCPVKVSKGAIVDDLVAALARRRVRRLGFERSRMSFELFDSLRAHTRLKSSMEPVSGWVERLRMVKSEGEIALIRQSVETNSRAFELAARHLRPGMSESDLAAEIEYRMRKLGAEKPAFETIVAAGPRSALPHAHPSGARFKARDLVLVDMGAMQQGYASDMTRMFCFGSPVPRARRLYAAVLEAQLAALAAVRAGVEAAAVDRAARRVLRAKGFGREFVHSTGHGLGLEIHEAPRLGKKESLRLEPGMTITVEPGAYLEGFGGVRIEDTVVVTPTGCEILTPTGKELRTV
jgi:Xaa-Pro aminopeptidase